MKKSLILVMCDVLVLSAMSLSSGAFEDDARQAPSVSSVAEPSVDETEDLRNQLASLKASVREIEERSRVAEAKAKESEEKTKAAEAETAEAKEETRQALEGKAVAEAKAKESEEKTKAAEAETAEANEKTRQALEGKAVAEAKARESEEKTKAAEAETAEANEKTRQALEGKAIAEAEKDRYRNLYDQYGRSAQERTERIGRIKSSSYLVTVSRTKGQDAFHAPVVNIEGDPFVLARYDGKTLNKVNEVILHGPSGTVYKAVAAYYGVEKAGKDIVLFEFLPLARGLMTLTLGQDSGDALRFWVSSQTGKVYQAPVLNADLKAAYKDYDQINPGDLLVDSGNASIIAMALSRGSVWDWFNAKSSITFDRPVLKKDLTRWSSCKIGERNETD